MVIIVLTAIDQLIKYFICLYQPHKKILPGILELTYSKNTGTVFGIAPEHNFDFLVLSTCIIIMLTIIIFKLTKKYDRRRFYWDMVIAGGIGNLIDRVYRGFVVDYLYIKPFGICNFADIVIVIGILLFLINLLRNSGMEDNQSGGK